MGFRLRSVAALFLASLVVRAADDEQLDLWRPDPASASGLVTEKIPKAEVGKIIDELLCRRPARTAADWMVSAGVADADCPVSGYVRLSLVAP